MFVEFVCKLMCMQKKSCCKCFALRSKTSYCFKDPFRQCRAFCK